MSLITNIVDVCGRDLGTFFCDVCNNQTINGVKTFANTTVSSSSGNGALVVTGGAGIGGNLNVGETINGLTVNNSNINVSGNIIGATGVNTTGGITYIPYFYGNYQNRMTDSGGGSGANFTITMVNDNQNYAGYISHVLLSCSAFGVAGNPYMVISSPAVQISGSLSASSLSVGTGTIGGGAITGSSLSAGSGTISTTGDISGGAIRGSSLKLGSGTISTTGDISGGAIRGSSLSAGSGGISTTGTITGSNFMSGNYYNQTNGGGNNIYINNTTTNPAIYIDQGISNSNNGLYIYNSGYGSAQSIEMSMVQNGTFSYGVINGHTSGVSASTHIVLQQNIAGGYVGIGTYPNYQLHLSADSAAKPSSSAWTVSSDKRLKTNIELADLSMCYQNVKSLPLKRYTWLDEVYTVEQVADRSKLGWIAQDVQQYFSKSVTAIDMHDILGCLSMNADQIYASMYGSIQMLMSMVESQSHMITDLQNRLSAANIP